MPDSVPQIPDVQNLFWRSANKGWTGLGCWKVGEGIRDDSNACVAAWWTMDGERKGFWRGKMTPL